MTRAALVMGFGSGQANKDIVDFVADRNRATPFQYILTQYAVLAYLQQSIRDVPVSLMHEHSGIYVNTLDAFGLGLINLHKIAKHDAPFEIEILAHSLQFERANETGKIALMWLKQTPRNASNPNVFLKFIDTIMLTQPKSPKPMHLNRIRESWHQPWTCNPLGYRTVEIVAKWRDFIVKGNHYSHESSAYYEHINDLEKRLVHERKKMI